MILNIISSFGNTGEYREIQGIHGNTEEYKEIHGNTGE